MASTKQLRGKQIILKGLISHFKYSESGSVYTNVYKNITAQVCKCIVYVHSADSDLPQCCVGHQ